MTISSLFKTYKLKQLTMKKQVFLALAALTAIAYGCSSEEFANSRTAKGNDYLVASIDDASTRTALSESNPNQVLWETGDQISVFADANTPYELSDGAGTSSATFSGSATGTKHAVLYPYNASASYNSDANTISYTLGGAAYTYDKQNPSKTNGAPMAGLMTVDDPDKVSFKHAGAVIDLSINNVPAGYSSATLTSKAASEDASAASIAGPATITFDTAGVPSLTIADGDGTSTSATVNFEVETENTQNVRLIFPLPIATYGELVLTLNGTDKEELTVATWSNVEAARASRLYATKTVDTVTGTVQVEVSSSEDATKALESSNAVVVDLSGTSSDNSETTSVETTATIKLPEVTATTEDTTPVSLTLSNVTSATSSIKIEEAEENKASKEVTVAASTAAETSEIPSLEVTLPASTVTLATVDESAEVTYTEVTASTAANTLVVGKGVTIKTLKVKKGNILVKAGAKIETVVRTEDNGDEQSIITLEESATIDTGSDDNIVVKQPLTYLEKVQEYLASGKANTVWTLEENLSLTEPLFVTASGITLDLNGHSITPAGTSLTKVLNTSDALIAICRGGDLTIADSGNGGTIDSGESTSISCAVKMTIYGEGETGDEAKLTVTGGTLKGYYYAVSGNGTRHGTEVNVKGGTLATNNSEDGCAIYNPQDGTINVTGGYIVGPTGIEIRSGKLVANGGTIEGTLTTNDVVANGNGTTTSGAAIAVAQHTTLKAIDVQIKDGSTIKGAGYALIESNPQGNGADDIAKVTIAITGGTIEGFLSSVDCKNFITGGTFSDLPSALAFASTGTITISKDQSVETLDFNNATDLTVDLNKKVVTVANPSIITLAEASDKLTIKNGEISNKDAYSANKAFIDLEVGDFTLNDVDIITTKYGCGLWGQQSTVNLTVTGGTLTGAYFSYSSNALTSNSVLVYGSGAKASFTNTVFSSPETGFMMNVPVTFTFEGCTFSGNHQGALLRGGTYIFNGDKNALTLKAELPSTHSECHNTSAWKSGNQAAFAALVIGNNQESTAYQYPTSVTFNGTTTVKTEGTYASSFPEVYVTANSSTNNVTITGAAKLTNGTTAPQVEYYTENITVDGEAITKTEDSTDDAQ
jgi:uncharacterized Zn ribbon protein